MGAGIQRLKRTLSDLGDDLLAFIVPDNCIVCSRPLLKGEKHLCLHCLSHLPRTGICSDGFTPLHEKLASTSICIERVASWFYYTQGSPYNAIITVAKYSNRPSLSRMSGRVFAREIFASDFFKGIDMIQPVPLATIKKLKRGYNHSEQIAEGISSVTGIPVVDLLKARPHSTQTDKSAYGRFLNSLSVFSTKKNAARNASGRHILLVDDVLTTGATILACAEALSLSIPDIRISVLTIGTTRQI